MNESQKIKAKIHFCLEKKLDREIKNPLQEDESMASSAAISQFSAN